MLFNKPPQMIKIFLLVFFICCTSVIISLGQGPYTLNDGPGPVSSIITSNSSTFNTTNDDTPPPDDCGVGLCGNPDPFGEPCIPCNEIPFDGGLIFLLIGGLIVGIRNKIKIKV